MPAGLAKKGRFHERNYLFFWSADCAVRDPTAPQDAQAETADCRIRITNHVPVLRIDHISINGMLLRVRQAPYRRERDSDSGEMNRGLLTNRFSQRTESSDKHEKY